MEKSWNNFMKLPGGIDGVKEERWLNQILLGLFPKASDIRIKLGLPRSSESRP
jgi:hypothetical protein